MTASTLDTSARTPLKGWLAVLAVTLGIFSLVTTEILPIGLLTPIGEDFRITPGTAGLTMTLPGFLAALAAPVVTVAAGRIDRRALLCVLMAVLALADVVAATAQAYWAVLVSRILVGLVIGAFWAIGSGLATRLVGPGRAGTATAVIFSAVPLGSVLGVPAGTFVGELFGWRAAFAMMGVFTLGVLALLAVSLPSLPPMATTRLRVLRELTRGPATRLGLLVTMLVVLAHFGTYTYVTPLLRDVTRVSPELITVFLLVYGTAGIVGNFVAGAAIARDLRLTFLSAAGAIGVAMCALPFLGDSPVGTLALLVLWGFAYGAVPVCSGTWFAKAAPHAPEAASVLFTSSFQATLSAGALLGGFIVDAASVPAVMPAGGVVALLAVAVLSRARPA
ncbi:MFS transporter [Amycolatopsis regifaucium]|uniref:Transporter n=1 Tax=Amycolatopsis regifaucium TaxID=546365 RepID=A0A154M6E8_9PSEU|nr:MFS transporter [Amycolatopsis regifaucium]KZB79429.1 transporter [Amycolatopsis regifaucium]OKA07610.1 MFS transporter [Amycolatopsis regifaucium]SFH07144.1 Predicted arabinose efflux permease, MFS family [Amycolatopsis regifaucium]